MEKKIKKQNTKIEMTKLFIEVRDLILSARKAVVQTVDALQVITNFEIGRRIVEYEQKGKQRAEYGEILIKSLSNKLTKEFGNGFSKRNLEYIRKFYLVYQDRTVRIAQTLSAQSQKSKMRSGKLQKAQTVSAKLLKNLVIC